MEVATHIPGPSFKERVWSTSVDGQGEGLAPCAGVQISYFDGSGISRAAVTAAEIKHERYDRTKSQDKTR